MHRVNCSPPFWFRCVPKRLRGLGKERGFRRTSFSRCTNGTATSIAFLIVCKKPSDKTCSSVNLVSIANERHLRAPRMKIPVLAQEPRIHKLRT